MTKGPEAFRTISEAADELNVPQHVLRFWETKFNFIRPMKRAGGRRFYRPSDIAVLQGVRRLLHDEGYTIKGVQRLHREQGLRRLVTAGQGEGAAGSAAETSPPPDAALTDDGRERLTGMLHELEDAKRRLDDILKG
ncbi:MAG: transcriptional regulator, putative MerR family [Phenylobacterium sp.]|nr:transcriptional regulator, putative MerR family [Phenylobacterium sp.]